MARAAPVEHWQVFLDESGSFDAMDLRVVAGLAVCAPARPAQVRALREELAARVPGVPYPPHAAWHNVAAGRLAGYVLQRARAGEAAVDGVRGRCEPAWQALVQADVQPGYRRALERDRLPSWRDVRACDAWLRRRAPDAHHAIRALCRRDGREVAELLRASAGPFGAPEAFLVAAAHPPGRESAAPDRYLELLGVLAERLGDLLAGPRPPARRAWLTVAFRKVEVPGATAPVPLRPALVRGVLDRVIGPGVDNPRFTVEGTPGFDHRVHPGVVLADWIANRTRHSLRETGPMSPWTSLAGSLARSVGLPASAPVPALPEAEPLPTLAADGPAREAIAAARRGRSYDLEGIPTRWARDQAGLWTAALRLPGREAP